MVGEAEFGCSSVSLFIMDEADVNVLIEQAACLGCLMPGELDLIEAYLISLWSQ